MRTACGDLWDWHPGTLVAITTGAGLDRRGRALMLRGVARQARERYQELPIVLGELLRTQGNRVHLLPHQLVSFPVEDDPFEIARPEMIRRSCAELVDLADRLGWSEVVLPRPGCGGGLLDWQLIQPVLASLLDDRFVVVAPPGI